MPMPESYGAVESASGVVLIDGIGGVEAAAFENMVRSDVPEPLGLP